MNNDLISRSVVLEMLRDKALGYTVSMFATSGECNIARVVATECAAEVKNLPAVDAVPVRHGRWLKLAYAPEWTKCSECNCHWEWGLVENCNMTFCPNCGARMDGGAENA